MIELHTDDCSTFSIVGNDAPHRRGKIIQVDCDGLDVLVTGASVRSLGTRKVTIDDDMFTELTMAGHPLMPMTLKTATGLQIHIHESVPPSLAGLDAPPCDMICSDLMAKIGGLFNSMTSRFERACDDYSRVHPDEELPPNQEVIMQHYVIDDESTDSSDSCPMEHISELPIEHDDDSIDVEYELAADCIGQLAGAMEIADFDLPPTRELTLKAGQIASQMLARIRNDRENVAEHVRQLGLTSAYGADTQQAFDAIAARGPWRPNYSINIFSTCH